jgi:hypothetical protein
VKGGLKKYIGAKGKILTVDEKTTRDTSKKCYQNSMKQHRHTSSVRNTEGRRLATVSSTSTAREFKPVNGAPNLTLSPTMFL